MVDMFCRSFMKPEHMVVQEWGDHEGEIPLWWGVRKVVRKGDTVTLFMTPNGMMAEQVIPREHIGQQWQVTNVRFS